MLGKSIVVYNCQYCESNLESPLEEAGSKQACPTCQHEIMTPGRAALQKQRDDDAQKAALIEQRRTAAAAAAKEHTLATEALRQARLTLKMEKSNSLTAVVARADKITFSSQAPIAARRNAVSCWYCGQANQTGLCKCPYCHQVQWKAR